VRICRKEKANNTFKVIQNHIQGSLNEISQQDLLKTVIAYEPVWAIGTGKTATPEQAQEVHKYIRDLLRKMYSEEAAEAIRIQYGGSVKPENIAELIGKPDVDGA